MTHHVHGHYLDSKGDFQNISVLFTIKTSFQTPIVVTLNSIFKEGLVGYKKGHPDPVTVEVGIRAWQVYFFFKPTT